jgi:hypothetical protein
VADIASDSGGAYLLATEEHDEFEQLEGVNAIYRLRLTPEMVRVLLANAEVREYRRLEIVAAIDHGSQARLMLETVGEHEDGDEAWAEPVISSMSTRLIDGHVIAFASSITGQPFVH